MEKEEAKLTEAKLLAKPIEVLTPTNPLTFNGMTLSITDDMNPEIHINQSNYLTKLTPILNSAPRIDYIAQRARGAYISTASMPQASYGLSIAAQSIDPSLADKKDLNTTLQKMKNTWRTIKFVKLDIDSLRIVVFSDSSFANNYDCSSQIGYIIILIDKFNKANIIHWSSIKCKRVTRSVLASELYGTTHGFDVGGALKSTLEAILSRRMPLILAIDSRSLYDCLVKLGTTKEKRLMIDIIRQSYERREIADIIWIPGSKNPADAMTKKKPGGALEKLIETNEIWSIRVTSKVSSNFFLILSIVFFIICQRQSYVGNLDNILFESPFRALSLSLRITIGNFIWLSFAVLQKRESRH